MLLLRMSTIMTSSPYVEFGASIKETLKPYDFGVLNVLGSPSNY